MLYAAPLQEAGTKKERFPVARTKEEHLAFMGITKSSEVINSDGVEYDSATISVF